jgi:hypothetical protein
MNTANKKDQKNQRQKTRQKHGPKKEGRNPNLLHDDRKFQEHEHPETRLTR